MLSRLETIDPLFARTLRSADEDKRRHAVHTACRFAIERSGVNDPFVEKALSAIGSGERLAEEDRMQLGLVMEQIDHDYLMLDKRSKRTAEADAAVLSLFSQARAAAAVLYGSKWYLPDEAAESIYEAALVTDQPEELLAVLRPGLAY